MIHAQPQTPAQSVATTFPDITIVLIALTRTIPDRQGALALVDGGLAAVLVRLDDPSYEDLQGCWAMEVGFGVFDVCERPVFKTLAEADRWAAARLTGSPGALCEPH
jgi:hypothetical protein